MANKRPDGDGLVRKRSDGRWEGRIVVGHKDNGKPIYRSVFARSQKELMDKLHRSIEMFRDVELKENSNLTLGEWLDKWLDERMRFTIRESTLDGYLRLAKNYIKPHLGDKKIGSITTSDVQKMYNWLRENGRINEHYEKGYALSDSMVRGIHMMLHQAMDAAVQERIIVKNPTDGTVIPKANYAPKKILTEAQLQKFLDVVRQDPVWSDFFYTELTTGMRRGEICGLRWQDFDEKTGRLHIRRSVTSRKGGGVKVGETKTEKGTRTIQLPPSTIEILKARKKKSYSDWIFHDPTVPELPLSPVSAYHRMKTLLRYAELPQIRFHDLRHTFATTALEHGMDVKTLSASIGHISAATTLDIYSHITDRMQLQAAARIDRTVPGNEATPIPEAERPVQAKKTEFTPFIPKQRKSGTGMVHQIPGGTWEGRYSPKDATGKRISKNVYAKTKEECEAKLAELIPQMKAEIEQQRMALLAQAQQEQESGGMTMSMC